MHYLSTFDTLLCFLADPSAADFAVVTAKKQFLDFPDYFTDYALELKQVRSYVISYNLKMKIYLSSDVFCMRAKTLSQMKEWNS